MTGVGTWWRTVRHLKSQQVTGRVLFRLRRPTADRSAPPPLRTLDGGWVEPARREPSLVSATSMRLLNQDFAVDRGWDDESVDRLLRYNAHYFDDLAARDSAARRPLQRALVARWVAENPPVAGTGWEPYPVSLRAVNWIKWFRAGAVPEPAWVDSLAVQVRHLRARLETHLLGNHLFVNAKALVFAGVFFDGAEARGWLDEGLAILHGQLPEQVLPDGGQFELSPMYHALALEDVLDLVNIAGSASGLGAVFAQPLAEWRAAAPRMLHWLRCLQHPDGGLADFNDSTASVAPDCAELERYAAALGIAAARPASPGITRLPDSGYVRVDAGRGLLLLDVARIGPDYLPAHAHADTLSFELSVGDRRVLVNGGTSTYNVSPRRAFERGTAAHNTVEVGGSDSSEVWGGFRVGRRARPRDIAVDASAVSAAHDGYRFLPGAPLHRRRWSIEANGVAVLDEVDAPAPAIARYHLAPGLVFVAEAPGTWRVDAGGTRLARVVVRHGDGHVVASTHATGFNAVRPTECLEVALRAGRANTHWSWEPS